MNNPQFWKNKNVLVTGACGTIGNALIDELLDLPVNQILGIDNNESELFFIADHYRQTKNISFELCDIRLKERLIEVMQGVDIVLHAAALKHVIICEKAPVESIYTNILGSQNIIEAAKRCEVERVIFTSSDKAVNPTNVMGTSKLMGERLITAANAKSSNSQTIFASTRFGNVLGSNGSVIPLFKKQILNGGPVTLIDPEMSRFIMTVKQAASLVIKNVNIAKGGEVFVTKMPSIKISDLAEVMVSELSSEKEIGIKVIGAKPGEKLYEELMNEEEIRRTMELEDFFVILPAFRHEFAIDYDYENVRNPKVDRIYRSDMETYMSNKELSDFLNDNFLIH